MAALRVVGEAGLDALGEGETRERRSGDRIELGFAEIELGPLPGVPFRQLGQEGLPLRIRLLLLDAADVIGGVVGRAQDDLA